MLFFFPVVHGARFIGDRSPTYSVLSRTCCAEAHDGLFLVSRSRFRRRARSRFDDLRSRRGCRADVDARRMQLALPPAWMHRRGTRRTTIALVLKVSWRSEPSLKGMLVITVEV